MTYLLSLSVEQVGRESSLRYGSVVLLLYVSLVVGLERLLELDLLRVSLRVVKLGLETEQLLRSGRRLVDLTSGSLTTEGSERRREKGQRRFRLSSVEATPEGELAQQPTRPAWYESWPSYDDLDSRSLLVLRG